MKTILKSFFVFALGLSLTLVGCSSDDDNDLRDELTGNYEVLIFISGLPLEPIATTLTVSKEEKGLRVAAIVPSTHIPGGSINMDLLLNSLSEVSITEGDALIEGYFFKIAEQKMTLGSAGDFNFSGTGMVDGSYDGAISKYSGGSDSIRDITFQIAGDFNDTTLTILVLSRE